MAELLSMIRDLSDSNILVRLGLKNLRSLVGVIIVILLIGWNAQYVWQQKRRTLPPGPWGVPIFGEPSTLTSGWTMQRIR